MKHINTDDNTTNQARIQYLEASSQPGNLPHHPFPSLLGFLPKISVVAPLPIILEFSYLTEVDS